MANTAWGIDIGNRGLKAVKLTRVAEGVKVDDFAFIEHDTILSEAGDNRDQLIQTSLAKFVGRHETRKVPICVGVSGQQSFARFVKLPPVDAKKIPEIVRFEAVQQIPFPLDDVEWSYQLFQQPDDPDIEVGIFAMRKELVNEQVQNFLDVDLDVHAVQSSPLAVYNAMRFDGRLDKGHAVIVDLGADSTDLIIADAESIWMRSLDIGGNNFTEALAKAFKINFEKAEEMKRNAKTSKYAKQIYQAMRPVFGELVGEIQRSLGFFQSSHRDAKLRKIIALGGGFRLNGLSGYVQKNLQMPVEKPTKFQALAPDEAGAASGASEHVLSAAAAYGMALQMLDEGKVNSSLLPTHIRKDKMWRDKTKYFAAAAAMVIAVPFIAFGSYLANDISFGSANSERNEVDNIISDAERLDSDWQTVSTSGSDQFQLVKNMNSLVQDRALWGQLLAEVYAAMPSPPPQVAQAMAGGLGEPYVYDEADKQAIASIAPGERAWVQIESIQSVYTAKVADIVNAKDFAAAASSVFSQKNRNTFESIAPGATTPVEAPLDLGENARGFVVRMVVTTPLPYDQAITRLVRSEDSLRHRLYSIRPTAERPNMAFGILQAEEVAASKLGEVSERTSDMESRFSARNNLETGDISDLGTSPSTDTEASGTGRNRPNRNQPPGGLGVMEGRGDMGMEGMEGMGMEGFQPRRGTVAPRPGTNADNGEQPQAQPAYIDPLTGDDRREYTQIEVYFVVVIDPPPYEAEQVPSEETGTDPDDPFADDGEMQAATDPSAGVE